MSEVLIKVEGVSKKFCKNLKQSLIYGFRDIFDIRSHELGRSQGRFNLWFTWFVFLVCDCTNHGRIRQILRIHESILAQFAQFGWIYICIFIIFSHIQHRHWTSQIVWFVILLTRLTGWFDSLLFNLAHSADLLIRFDSWS